MFPVDDAINFMAEMADMGLSWMMLLIGVKNAQKNISVPVNHFVNEKNECGYLYKNRNSAIIP